ncbi:MAG TPA: 16S rRNA (guanine(966)-N(2))-methyltransferase RsmD [Bacteroidales bacterium]|nr:16S rRNA (guanine(966)-N(2))-methyltransferase RsmD [Bacteroidales bacterium]
MRIVSGKYKGRHISPPKNFRARPTTDFAKENIFNILNNNFDFSELDVLDLFSGTGSISYEFASRECISVISIESNFKHHLFIKKTIEELGLQNVKTIKSDAFRYVKSCNKTFDIIFADPPYELKEIETIPSYIFEHQILKKDGWLIVEHGDKTNFSKQAGFKETRKYGGVNFSIFEHYEKS